MPQRHSQLISIILALGFLCPCSSSISLTYKNNHTIEELVWKRSPEHGNNGEPTFAILGVGGVSGGAVHPRLEIRKLEQDADQWNVFLLGLKRFQEMGQQDKLSYYQICGR